MGQLWVSPRPDWGGGEECNNRLSGGLPAPAGTPTPPVPRPSSSFRDRPSLPPTTTPALRSVGPLTVALVVAAAVALRSAAPSPSPSPSDPPPPQPRRLPPAPLRRLAPRPPRPRRPPDGRHPRDPRRPRPPAPAPPAPLGAVERRSVLLRPEVEPRRRGHAAEGVGRVGRAPVTLSEAALVSVVQDAGPTPQHSPPLPGGRRLRVGGSLSLRRPVAQSNGSEEQRPWGRGAGGVDPAG